MKIFVFHKYSLFSFVKIAYGPGIQPEKDDNPIETSNEASPPSYWAAAAAAGSPSSTSNRQSHVEDHANSPTS